MTRVRRADREAALPLPRPQIAVPFLASLAGSALGGFTGAALVAGLFSVVVRGGWL